MSTRRHRAPFALAIACILSPAVLFVCPPGALAVEPPAPGQAEHAIADPVAEAVARVTESISARSLRSYVDHLASYTTRHTLSDAGPRAGGIGQARNWIMETFRRATRGAGREGELAVKVQMERHTFPTSAFGIEATRFRPEIEIFNIVCEIPGAMPEARDRRYYAIAHYDSRASEPMDARSPAPGANDDASGVAALLELARVLADQRPDATIVLLATAGEEQGLYGARKHAEAAKASGHDVRAVLNNDTIGDPSGPGGRSAPAEIRVFSEGIPAALLADDERLSAGVTAMRRYATESDSPSRQLARYIADVARRHASLPVRPKLVFRADRFLRGGDHTAFNEQGFPAVRFTEVYEDYTRQHQDVREENGVLYGDLAHHVDEEYLRGVTMLNAAVLLHLANAPSAPPETRIIVASLTSDTTLRWSPSPEPDVAGYEVLWRDTTSPDWEHSLDVGDVNEYTIDLSKDNWIFGVRAYDRDGYRSPVAFPIAARE